MLCIENTSNFTSTSLERVICKLLCNNCAEVWASHEKFGKRGIRTLGKQKAYIAIPMLRLEPLGHLSYLMMPINREQKMSCRSNRTIYVGNLPGDIRLREVEDLFYKYGSIVDVDLKIPPRAPGYAFVEFEDARDAEDAIRYQDGYNFDGFRLRVELAHGGRGYSSSVDRYSSYSGSSSSRGVSRRSYYRVLVTGLPPSASWQDLKDHMRKAGDVCFSQVFRERGGMTGIVDYTNYDDMKYAIRKLDDSEFRNAFSRAYIRVREYNRGYSRSPSRDSRRSYSRSLSRSPFISRSRSRSLSYSDRSRSLSPKPKHSQRSTSLSRNVCLLWFSYVWSFAATWELHVRILMACGAQTPTFWFEELLLSYIGLDVFHIIGSRYHVLLTIEFLTLIETKCDILGSIAFYLDAAQDLWWINFFVLVVIPLEFQISKPIASTSPESLS
ncbi:hypothetical protein VNO78_20460 [Psophocarpus tetragonolobus]|uniref:RRM domain-containing protein n=1 Tax=Psophocarpus tetragonolobus TaxID=3891 RepID=A0AAN9XH59_PSOTE